MLFIDLTVEVIGKPEPRDWKNNEGQTMKSYRLNVAQNDGCDVATIRCPQIVYDSVRRGDRAVFGCSFAEYGDRTDFRIVDVKRYLTAEGKDLSKPGNIPSK